MTPEEIREIVGLLWARLGRRASGGHLSGTQRGRAQADLVPALLSPGRHTTRRPGETWTEATNRLTEAEGHQS